MRRRSGDSKSMLSRYRPLPSASIIWRHTGLRLNRSISRMVAASASSSNRLPSSQGFSPSLAVFNLMSYGVDGPDAFRGSSVYVHKILQGSKPADLPVEQPTKFELVINLKTAKTLDRRSRNRSYYALTRSSNKDVICCGANVADWHLADNRFVDHFGRFRTIADIGRPRG
jgi:hypothetical protein